MTKQTNTISTLSLAAALALALTACGEDGHDHDHDHGEGGDASLAFVTAPGEALTVGEDVDVVYTVATEGDLHHTEIRACKGHSTDCGLGGEESFDSNYAAAKDGEQYNATVNIDEAGPWTIVIYAHVGADPHISAPVHATASE